MSAAYRYLRELAIEYGTHLEKRFRLDEPGKTISFDGLPDHIVEVAAINQNSGSQI